jgi:hypothetical protein
MKVLRYLWTSPTTMPGLLVAAAALLSGGEGQVNNGVLEVHGGFASIFLRHLIPLSGGASAMTLGHVVIARDARLLDLTRAHERVHVRQAERWGPLFIPLYLGASLIAWLKGDDPYKDNVFEREAFERSG